MKVLAFIRIAHQALRQFLNDVCTSRKCTCKEKSTKESLHEEILQVLKRIDKKTDLLPLIDLKVSKVPKSKRKRDEFFCDWLKQLDNKSVG